MNVPMGDSFVCVLYICWSFPGRSHGGQASSNDGDDGSRSNIEKQEQLRCCEGLVVQ